LASGYGQSRPVDDAKDGGLISGRQSAQGFNLMGMEDPF